MGARPTELQKELYAAVADMQHRAMELLRPGITSHEAAKLRPTPRPVFKNVEDIKAFRSGWTNHFGGIGSGWWEAPNIVTHEPPVLLEKNMTIAYHAMFWVDGQDGVAVENTFRITDTGCEILGKWPWEEMVVIGA